MNDWHSHLAYGGLTPQPATSLERMHHLLENGMAGRTIRRFVDEKLQAEIGQLPLAAIYVEETDGTLVVGMTRKSQGGRERHEQTLDCLSRFIGGESGVPHRLTYLDVYRDFKNPISGGDGGGGIWDDRDGDDGRGDDQWKSPITATQILRGGLSLGCVGTLCLIYTLGRGQQAAILSSHTIGSSTGEKIFGPEKRPKSKWGTLGKSNKAGRASADDAAELIAIVTANPSLIVRTSDSALALLTDLRVLSIDHSIWQASDREYHVTSYVSSIETPLETKVGMQSVDSAGSASGVTTRGCIRHKRCSVRDAWGTLTDQVLADYAAHPGDSGAPVFIAGRGADEVGFVGIHVGRIVEESGRSLSFYSTWEAIKLELQLPAPRW